MTEHPISPVPDDGWRELTPETTALLTERLFDFQIIRRSRQVTNMRTCRLAFYPDHVLCDIRTEAPAEPVEWVCCLYGRDGFRKLNGDSSVIHGLNADVGPGLEDPEVQRAYLKFFCFFVHGEEGPFEIITTPDQLAEDIDLPVGQPALDTESNLWTASVLYGSTLFEAQFRITDDGHISMEADTPLREDVARNPALIFDGAIRRMRQET